MLLSIMCRVDPVGYKSRVEELWNEFHIPIWVTEFDWNSRVDTTLTIIILSSYLTLSIMGYFHITHGGKGGLYAPITHIEGMKEID